jgi:hypothetical protein
MYLITECKQFIIYYREEVLIMTDKTLVCKDCGADFVFTAGEQEFYAEKGFDNEPTRCKACRDKKKSEQRPRNNNRR